MAHNVSFVTSAMRSMKSYVHIIDVAHVCEYSGSKKDVENHMLGYFWLQRTC